MSKIKGAFTHQIDLQTVRLLAAVGKTQTEAAKFLGCSLRTFLYRFSEKKIADAWKNGRELFYSIKKTGNSAPDIFKTKNYVSRRISKNPDDAVNIFATALMIIYEDNFGSFDGLSWTDIAKGQIKYFYRGCRK
ncbi:helix-turn-helix domain containing protein [Candidatus Termititenax aidoneus]|uniref:Helix-turn-helix domain containing protein n=1 Tax=Termititenax aidoneus TaxID=2218524 RepID=A0A388TEU1_TERA1|nr:helix-turn-helix domain containing protein [Candidatus Termititenax aidoneus]